MARYRPETTNSGEASWLGFQQAQIIEFNDRSEEFDWADLFLDVTLKTTSQYPVNYALKGTYEREDSGEIKDSSLLKRIYYLLDAIGFKGGPNKEGVWEDENGTAIDDIGKYLNENFIAKDALDGDSNPFYVYVYKRLNPKDNKAYTEVCPKIVKNTNKNQEDLKSYIKFMKSKGYIKEHIEDGETISSEPVSSTPF
jgi:hypothetical protein